MALQDHREIQDQPVHRAHLASQEVQDQQEHPGPLDRMEILDPLVHREDREL